MTEAVFQIVQYSIDSRIGRVEVRNVPARRRETARLRNEREKPT
jgi:hypothetical protein